MKNLQYERCSSIIVLFLSLLIHGCHPSHLYVRDEETSLNKADGAIPVSSDALSTPATSLQASLKRPLAGTVTDTGSNEKIPDGGVVSMLTSRKRSAEALFQDTEEKKESPTALGLPVSRVASMTPGRSIAASMTQASQESATMMASPVQAATTLAKAESQDTVMTLEDTKDAAKKTSDEVEQEIPADLKRWFKEFAEAVDDEEVLSLGDISEAIPRLVQEGKEKGYLTQSMKLIINEVGWEPDCTPLHYAAAKGNPQAVEALVKEPEVVIDARTQEAGTTPLQFAAYDGHLRAAERLISAYKERGKIGEIDVPDRQGTSALQYAASGPRDGMNREVAELLVAHGANPNQSWKDCSLVDLSAMVGNLAMVEYWIEKIAGTEHILDDKAAIMSAIKIANRRGYTSIVTILQDYYKDL